jgi:hypothetical protein
MLSISHLIQATLSQFSSLSLWKIKVVVKDNKNGVDGYGTGAI